MTPQHPISSGFGPATTATEALAGRDLAGKVALVTGGYSGLGLETARVLAGAGATVIVPARTPDKARAALAGVAGIEMEELDLMDPASVDGLAARFLTTGRPLHMLVNSAGVMASPLSRDAAGNESQFSTNHLGHFRLAARLWPALRQAEGARVVSVSSRGHFLAGMDFDDPNFERRDYDRWIAYAQSKTANVLFAVALDRRGQAHGIRGFSLHPGQIVTDLARWLTPEDIASFSYVYDEEGNFRHDPENDLKTVPEGAATSVWCAVSPQLDGLGGVYCENSDIAPVTPPESDARRGVRPWAIDPELAERLWGLSERLTGVTLAA